MLSEKFLNEFEEYLKSGRLEEDYACSAEDRKVEILEYPTCLYPPEVPAAWSVTSNFKRNSFAQYK